MVIFTTGAALHAQTKSIKKSPPLSEDSTESVGMSSERLARIDDMCKEAVLNGDIPGVVALVARNGKIVYHKAFGMADNISSRSLKSDDIFRIASQSKAITATAVMMLWEEGKFFLDDPISKYIPEFKNPQVLDTFQQDDTSYTTVAASGEITIRHLLTHTSGVGFGILDRDERFTMIYQKAGISGLSTKDISIEESIKTLAKLPLHHNPGEKYTYCFGLEVLGYFIEVVSGMPFDVFLKERLFDPLEMNDTWFYLPEDKAKRLVSLQTKSDKGEWIRCPVTHLDWDFPIKGAKRLFSGGGGLCSTAKDYATFLQMYLNGGELNGIRFLSRTTVEYIMTYQNGDIWGENSRFNYGLVFGVTTQKGQGLYSAGAFHWSGGFNTEYYADPKENIIGILMKQTQGIPYTDNTHRKFLLLVRQAVDD